MSSRKFLIIRFSAIGDVVLTTPVIRSLRKHFPEAEIHYLTKASMAPLLRHNPHVDKLHLLQDDLPGLLKTLKAERFDHVLDLHRNLRSLRVKRALGIPASSFSKRNIDKWLLCQAPLRRFARPIPHVVARYGKTLGAVGASLDDKGLELFLPDELVGWSQGLVKEAFGSGDPLAIVLGATYTTKRWPREKFPDLLNLLQRPVLLLGGPDTLDDAGWITERLSVPVLNAVGGYSILESAALMKTCREVITHDTGFMHIAAAFGQRVISLWGNTVPEFGMTPYRTPHEIIEAKDVKCRPCSKLGHDRCPIGHFACMSQIEPEWILSVLKDKK